jgi:hypothetical protein
MPTQKKPWLTPNAVGLERRKIEKAYSFGRSKD